MSAPIHQRLFDRLVAKTVTDKRGCWLWQGSLHTSTKYPAGHHGLTMLNSKSISTHRAMWIAVHGAIPDDMHVCHSCDVPRCINPEHLWLGTHQENMADMNGKGRNSMSSKTHCKAGHAFTPENTYTQMSRGVARGRGCRICARAAGKRYRDRKGAAA